MNDLNRQNTLENFKKRRHRQWLLALGIIPIVAVALLMKSRILVLPQEQSNVFGMGFFALVILAIGFSALNWRCPACNKYLGRSLSPKFCAGCGVQLQG